jgi:glycosyltransferase involved in cell wall biosynthesis/ubiquinone/menaquinone biosynthesis C-methylase UbiE
LKLSILVPVYNERTVVERSLAHVLEAPLPEEMEREIILVDDCSTDGTLQILERLVEEHPSMTLIRHEVNRGKGAAIQTAIGHATGDFCLVQDADLEYDPAEYPILLKPLLDGHADAVFGSRYLVGSQTRVLPFWHSRMNAGLTLLSNVFSNLNLTDMETCYKVFHTDLLKSIPIRSDRFGFEPEITMKCAKRQLRIYEVPISYHGRSYEEGKKIGWKDGVQALTTILKFWLIDDLYTEPMGRGVLNTHTGTPNYIRWITRIVRPHLGDTVLELGAGIGTLSGRLMARRLRYVAADSNDLNLHALRNRFLKTPSVDVAELEPEQAGDYQKTGGPFDTVLCLNLLEYAEDPGQLLENVTSVLKPGGRVVVLVPQNPGLYGALDESLGLKRRFSKDGVVKLIAALGLEVEQAVQINKASAMMWWFQAKLLRRKRLGKPMLKVFDKTVWLWRMMDKVLPWRGLSLVVVAKRPEGVS